MGRSGRGFRLILGLEWVQTGGLQLFLSGVDSWAKGAKKMATGPVGNFLEEHVRFFIFVEAETKHTGGTSEAMEKRLILTILEHFWNRKHPYDSVRLHVNESEPVFFL